MDGTMEKSFGQRYIRLYDQELVVDENQKTIFDAQARAKALVQETQALQIVTVNYSEAHDPCEKQEDSVPLGNG